MQPFPMPSGANGSIDPIAVFLTPPHISEEQVMSAVLKDVPELLEATEAAVRVLTEKGVIIFESRDNLLVTDKGFFLVLRMSDMLRLGIIKRKEDPTQPKSMAIGA